MLAIYALSQERRFCAACRNTISSSGVRRTWGVYCCDACDQLGVRALVDYFGEEPVELAVAQRAAEPCSHCRGDGPLVVRHGTRATSFFVGCATTTTRHLGCDACTRKRLRGDLLHTVLLGFWSFFGVVMAPMALWRTARELRRPGDDATDLLREMVLDGLLAAHLRATPPSPPQQTLVTPLATVGGGWS